MVKLNIRYYREQRGLSRDELAARVGISREELFDYENEFKSPHVGTLDVIARVLDVPPSDLVQDTPPEGLFLDVLPQEGWGELQALIRERGLVATTEELRARAPRTDLEERMLQVAEYFLNPEEEGVLA